MSDDWSTPALYSGRSRVAEPRMFTEADPISTMFVAEWDDGAADGATWGTTTYVGKRRLRPGTRPASETIRARHPEAVATPETSPDEPVTVAQSVGQTEAELEVAPDERSDRGLMANSRTMAVASLASRITGFLRSSLLAAALGTGLVGDAYNIGNNLPNMVYELLLGGVLSSVLIPLLVQAQEDDEDDGVGYTQRLLSIATAALAGVTVLAVLGAPLFASGFVHSGAQRSLTGLFATLLLPEIFFYGLGAMFMAVLNVRHSYGPGAWSPVLNNVVLIITVAVFWALPGPASLNPATITTPQVLVLGIGTTLGIAAQALVLLPALRRSGFRWHWRFRALPHEVGRLRDAGRLAFWVLGYVIASQIGVTVIASVGGHRHAFTTFTFADLLIQMPYGILVVSLLTALMPRLSRAAARGETARVVDDLGLGARLSALALVPVTVGLIALGPAFTTVLFAYGQVTIQDARLIGVALASSAFGLFPFAMVMLQLRVFYAMRDGRTPTLVNVFMVGTKVLIVLVGNVTVGSASRVAVLLTVATSASYVVGAITGQVLLARKFGRLGFSRVMRTLTQIGTASVLGGAAAYAVVLACQHSFGEGRLGAALALVLGGVSGLIVLFLVVWRLRMPEVRDLGQLIGQR